ncbi:MAG: ACP S-malonyltransferase [Desulfobacteraceae bacterium]|nr:ACP S-malonyltransferase [Desulfobacteraceae bacterium]
MKKTAYLFPGQGSQAVGMGLDFYQEFDVVRELFDSVEEISRINISKLCFKGPIEDLTETVNLQPAITAVNLACFTAMEKAGLEPTISAGHSLGEYSALCASGIVSREDTFRLVFKRGELMHREATRNQGAMHAIIGLPINAVAELVAEVQKDGVVAVANHNAELQIVITGAPEPVNRVSDLAASQGAKAIPLKVSGAWHSELIQGAQDEFRDVIESIGFNTPEKPMVFNVTADVESNPEEIQSIMARQFCNPVKWYDSMCRLMAENIEIFVEVGPGRVLAGLLKKVLPKDYPGKIYNVNSMKSLDRFLNETT